MVDFLQSKKPASKPIEKKDKQSSWLRGLLHPVNGDKDDGKSIDLLSVAKKQVVETPETKVQSNKKAEHEPKPSFGIDVEPKKENKLEKKKLTTDGSKKIRKGFDVNLLPATFRFQSTKKIITMLSLWLVVALVVLGVAYVGISFYGQQVTEEGLALEAEIEYLDSEIFKFNSDVAEASKWQVKLSAVDILLRTHVYWTNFFSTLEMTTLPSVYYSGFTASLINNNINLVSYAKSFSTVAEQLIAYERFPEVFTNFSVAEASLDEGIGINYNALVSLRRSLFYDKSFVNTNE